MTQSDVNQIFAALGREPVELDDGFLILANTPQAANIDFSAAALELNGKTYSHAGTFSNISMFAYCYFIAVVPDEAAEGLNLDVQGMAYDLGGVPYDAAALRSDLSYQYTSGSGHTYQRCDYFLKEYGRIQMNSNTAVFVLSALYIAVVFVFMAMAILALKTLSGLTEDKQRYDILFRLGADSREQSRTLFRQTFSFFLLPFALPMLLSIPTGIICSQIMILGGFPQQTGQILVTATAVAAVMALIYLLYFTATYLLAKQTVVRTAHS